MIFNKKETKTLIIMRHAKSSWDDSYVSDHERGLLDKGIKRTGKIAGFIQDNGINPDLIISSTAKRALTTAKIIAKSISYEESKIKQSKNLYLSYVDDVYDELFQLDNSIDSVMIFGHNPCFTDLVNVFANKPIDNLPTSGLAVIEFKTSNWENIPVSKSKLKHLVFPSNLD